MSVDLGYKIFILQALSSGKKSLNYEKVKISKGKCFP